ncbi:starry night [Carabus blaptoides fortunei]
MSSVLEECEPGVVVTTVKARDPENSPVTYQMTSLLERTYTVNVNEDANWTENPVIVHVKATNADQGNNLSVASNTQSQFSIDSLTGDILSVKPLDYESLRSYRLVIRSQDGGSPSRSNTTQLQINVKDINDNVPWFYTSLFQESDSESVPVGYSIFRMQAYDAFGKAITSQNDRELITVAQPPDYKQEKRYILTVTASDSGGRHGTASVYVNVSDANNFAPVFEDAPFGNTVPVISTTDNDVGINAQIIYSLGDELSSATNHSPEFSINSQTGAIVATKSLDRENISGYLLTVIAKDCGNPPLSVTTDIEISVTDVNDNYLTFKQQSYSGNILEDALIAQPKVASMEVSVTDGVNDVRAVMQLTVRLITEDMLFNSITVRLNKMTKEAFLSALLGFLLMVWLLSFPVRQRKYFYSDDTDVNSKILNVSFSARWPDVTREEYYSQQFLQERVYLNRAILARLATVLPFDDNLCVREPCLNYEECLIVSKFGNSSEFIHSEAHLPSNHVLLPVSGWIHRFKRTLPLCDTEVNCEFVLLQSVQEQRHVSP